MLGESSSGHYPISISEDNVLFSVSELDQGLTDLNGDGDVGDRVVHLFRGSTAGTTNLGWALPSGVERPFRSSPRWISFLVGESDQGDQDLNGDGLVGDKVLYAIDLATAAVSNLGQRVSDPDDYLLSGRDVAWTVRERVWEYLYGDGDSGDAVLFSRKGSSGVVTNHSLALFGLDGTLDMRAGRGTALFLVSEFGQGQINLNGDADATDWVLHLLEF
jgi:hypothetical protein